MRNSGAVEDFILRQHAPYISSHLSLFVGAEKRNRATAQPTLSSDEAIPAFSQGLLDPLLGQAPSSAVHDQMGMA